MGLSIRGSRAAEQSGEGLGEAPVKKEPERMRLMSLSVSCLEADTLGPPAAI
jgi:hypothetical protein